MKYVEGHSQDEVFIQKLTNIVLENLNSEQFGVSSLAEHIGLSRSHLHRKLKVLKGQSVSRFIREVRLKEAMKMLKQNVANVSEIAYSVGFSSTSYFNTCFHEYYGYPPGKVGKKHQAGIEESEVPEQLKTQGQFSNIDVPLAVDREDTAEADEPLARKIKMAPVFFIGLATVILLAAFFLLNRSKTTVAGTPPRAIAILPLDHLSAAADQEYLTDGIHDALIGELGTIKGLRVISRTSTLRYPESDLLAKDIAKELGVDAIVEGSVLIWGDSLRLQLQLIDVFPEEEHLWAQEYYQNLDNILSVQSNAIKDIASTIQINLTGEEEQRLTRVKKVDPQTYKSYLRGMYFLNKSTPEEFQEGLNYLHEAIALDPADPHAYAGLAEGYATLGHGPDPSNTYWQRGKLAAVRAIELDSNMAKGYATLGVIKLYFEGDWEGAELNFNKALAINPNDAFTRFHYAWYHILMGQMDEALKEHRLAKELDPLTPIITADMGMAHFWVGNYDKAITELEQALEIDNNFGHAWWALGNVYLQKGWKNKALEAHEQAVSINPVWKWALANTYAVSGDREKAMAIVADLKNHSISPRTAFGLVQVYVTLGMLDEAFYWLGQQPQDVWLPWLRTWPGFESLRKDSRFHAYLKEKKLPPIVPFAT
ncbi:MAG: helix-turn-helix domain-containing protein [Eudoraea sp.]|nr:helix-turn-helix domain-containing protein [Eudoraea sp.]